jgi:sulfopyruvate decarboxylase TPP-binding subunit
MLLQNSGLGNAVNALASLTVPFEIPVLMLLSQRGGLGEWNPVQVPMQLASRPVLDALGLLHTTVAREDELDVAIRAAARAAFDTGRGAAVILDKRLTAGGAL